MRSCILGYNVYTCKSILIPRASKHWHLSYSFTRVYGVINNRLKTQLNLHFQAEYQRPYDEHPTALPSPVASPLR